ncbi:transcriptional regulator, ArsR family [Methanoplanus limicola DSM 2279]|uniref:Transcriptional regulator, ArsR family n=2 Tax=Methanoplanus limicola TaxID=2315 RepID=H1Z1I1_9EURY|nr:transcriptional regulator, ArsR family [Methanoplanus limicola DSM 2279]
MQIYKYFVVQGRIKLLKALADETRIKIVQCLMDGERCACAIVPAVGKAQPTVSRHLRILEEAGVLESRRAGVNIWYKIRSKQTIQIMEILGIQKIETEVTCEECEHDK